MPFLYLGPAILAAVACASSLEPDPKTRHRVIVGCAWTGIALGIVTAVVGGDGVWRTTTLDQDAALIVGIAAACSWLLVATTDEVSGRWDVAALVGVAVSALTLFAANDWIVPALLFWMCASIAVGVLAFERHGGSWGWFAVAASDALVAVAFLFVVLDTGEWALPEPVSGWPRYALLGAIVLRSGVLPKLGIWGLMGSPAIAGLPLLVAGCFALLVGPAGSAEPWIAAAALFWSLIASGLSIAMRRISLTFTGCWPVALALGAGLVAPRAATGASVAAVLAVTVVALWPLASGRAGVERGLLLSFVPATAGFGVIVAAASIAFTRATAASTLADAASWTAVSALLPIALAAGVVMAIRTGRSFEPSTFEPSAVLATWGLLAVGLAFGIVSGGAPGLDETPLGPRGEVVRLLAVAVVAAVVAGIIASRRSAQRIVVGPAEGAFELTVPATRGRVDRALKLSAAALTVVAIGGTAWATIAGLRVGFL